MQKPTLIVIVGPTGSGKTDLSIAIAQRFGAPIISTDSRQFFRGMAIGTAQPSPEQLAAVRHYFIADREVEQQQTSGRYEKEALELVGELFKTHPIVVAVGGSGLYVDALCEGMDSLPEVDPALREGLRKRLDESGLESLCEELKVLDPEYFQKMDSSNPQRVMRALEVCLQAGVPYSSLRLGEAKQRDFCIIKIGVTVDRPMLYERINRRVDMMVESGILEEARLLFPKRHLNSLQTVGYRELFDYFDGLTSLSEAVELIKRNTRRYAKRQMTWFGRDASTVWFSPTEIKKIEKHIENLLERVK